MLGIAGEIKTNSNGLLHKETYIHQLCVDTGCSQEDSLSAMSYRDGWRQRLKGIRALMMMMMMMMMKSHFVFICFSFLSSILSYIEVCPWLCHCWSTRDAPKVMPPIYLPGNKNLCRERKKTNPLDRAYFQLQKETIFPHVAVHFCQWGTTTTTNRTYMKQKWIRSTILGASLVN